MLKIEEEGTGKKFAFKPTEGERFDARPGLVKNEAATLAEREVLASKVDQALVGDEWESMVAKTEIRTYEGAKGSAQEWLDGYDVERYGSGSSRSAQVRLGIFDALIGNLDRHGSNQMVHTSARQGQYGRLFGIDHGYSFGYTVPTADVWAMQVALDKGALGPQYDYLRSWALKETATNGPALSAETQKAIAKKIKSVKWDKVLEGSNLDEGERVAFAFRRRAVVELLEKGKAFDLHKLFKTRGA